MHDLSGRAHPAVEAILPKTEVVSDTTKVSKLGLPAMRTVVVRLIQGLAKASWRS